MGLLSIFSRQTPSLLRLPSGSFTIDRHGDILTDTLPSSFPSELVNEIGRQVLAGFQEAAAAQLPLSELIIDYPGLKISARELRGGAIIFMSPKTLTSSVSQK
jgi:hypothetical protein